MNTLAPEHALADDEHDLDHWTGAGRGGVRTVDVDGLEEQRPGFRSADGELRGVFPALGRRSDNCDLSAGRADDGGVVLAAGDVATRSSVTSPRNKPCEWRC